MNTLQSSLAKINEVFINYGGYISLILYLILAYVWFSYDPAGIVTKYHAAFIVGTLVIGFFVVTTADFAAKRRASFGSNASNPSLAHWMKIAGSGLGLLLIVGGLLYGVFWILGNFGRFFTLLVQLSYVISVIAGLALLYKILAPRLANVKLPDVLELVKNVIFYIPCLLIQLADNIAGTKKSVWILLLVEVLAVALYFVIPLIAKSKFLKIGTVLVDKPQYLNNIVSFDTDSLREVMETSRDSLHYALSADVWINPQPTSTSLAYTKDTNIVSFGDRVRVLYNGRTPQILIVKALEGQQMVEVARPNIKLQMWNKIVLNYDHGTLDVFVNGHLVHSQQNVPYLSVASVNAGAQDGINGGIKDIRFFDKPLTKNQIDLLEYV